MTALSVATKPELSREDLVTAVVHLAERLADLAAERDQARTDAADALEAACTLQQDRDWQRQSGNAQAELARKQADLAARFRDRFVQASTELRRANEGRRVLTERIQALEWQLDRRNRRRLPWRRLGRRGRPLRMPAFDGTQGCADNHDLWDAHGRGAEEIKRAICHACTFLPECLDWALDWAPSGFWGGHSTKQLQALRKRYGITLRTVEVER